MTPPFPSPPIGDRSEWQPHWPDLQEYIVPIGTGSLVREGTHATIVSYGRTLALCTQAADDLNRLLLDHLSSTH